MLLGSLERGWPKSTTCLVETGAMHFFMSSKLAKELGLPMRRAGKSINVLFAKREAHEGNEQLC